MPLVLALSASTILTSGGCKRPASGGQEGITAVHDTLFTITRGACFGKCPQYKVAVFRNSELVFTPVKHADFLKAGRFQMSVKAAEAFAELMQAGQWDTLKPEYPIAPDFPTATVTTYTIITEQGKPLGTKRKQVTVAAYVPEVVNQVLTFMDMELKRLEGKEPIKQK